MQHLQDTYSIACLLYDHWLSPQVKRRWNRLHMDDTVMRTVVLFLCSVHDVGKASPAFVVQHEALAQKATDAGLECPSYQAICRERQRAHHTLVGELTLEKWLRAQQVKDATCRALGSIVGAHHGRPVSAVTRTNARGLTRSLGGPAWQAVRSELADWMAAATGFDQLLAAGTIPDIPLPIQVEISGFVIVADWIASNENLYPLRPFSAGGGLDAKQQRRTDIAWDDLGMPPPWQPPEADMGIDEFYRHRFGWDGHTQPYAMQVAAVAAARAGDIGMMIIETTTGGGKTEAALAAAETIAARRGSQGIVVALPTQATTNAMFSRVARWVNLQPQPPAEVAAWALTLGHSKANLHPEFARLVKLVKDFEAAQPDMTKLAEIYDLDDQAADSDPPLCNAVAHQWFSSAKRRLLANFAVVTIDQILKAALQRKHLMLDHLALSGKVVVIDEAHASDEYMNTYLDSVLSWLGAYEVPVIVLSATLTDARRRAMLSAYDPAPEREISQLKVDPHAYPLLTVLPAAKLPPRCDVVPDRHTNRMVEVRWMPTAVDGLVARVEEALATGGCALVVRNTVADAQATFAALQERGFDTMLNHAGFLAVDRAANDQRLQELFGAEATGRPRQCVVVATQVVEQSLDVDFDVLFTDLAPMDLLLQRIGRLHRHDRARPAQLGTPMVHILADRPAGAPAQPTRGSTFVYGEHLLARTAAVLIEHGPCIHLPTDVSPLVQRALGQAEVGPPAWQEALLAASREHQKLLATQQQEAQTWCVTPWAGTADDRPHLGRWLETSNEYSEIQMGATVRDCQPSLEVIIVPVCADGKRALRPAWLGGNGDDGFLDTSSLPAAEVAREIATWTVRLPARLTRGQLPEVIEALAADPATSRWAWHGHPLLKGELFLAMKQSETSSGILEARMMVKGNTWQLRYSRLRGLQVSQA